MSILQSIDYGTSELQNVLYNQFLAEMIQTDTIIMAL